MNQVGMRFLLRGGVFINAVVTEQEARQLILDWHVGKLKGKLAGLDIPSNVKAGNTGWGVVVDDITAMHTFDPQELMTQTAKQQGPSQPWRNSGVNPN